MRPQPDDATRCLVSPMRYLFSDDIARVTGRHLRAVQRSLAKWRDAGGPVEERARSRGGIALAVPLDAYCARVGLAADDVLDVLGRAPLTAQAA